MLKQAMAMANNREGGPGCRCLACIVGMRCENFTRGYEPYAFAHGHDHHLVLSSHDHCHLVCQFKPWFEERIRENGMSVGVVVQDMSLQMWVDGGVVDDDNTVLDDGRHFSNLGRADWNAWVYGSRLWKTS